MSSLLLTSCAAGALETTPASTQTAPVQTSSAEAVETSSETVTSAEQAVQTEQTAFYTTPYGTFPLIEAVWEHNEHMLGTPSEPGEELLVSYLTDDPARADEVKAQLKALASEITAGCTTDAQRGRAISMWVGTNIAYDFDLEDDGSFEVLTAETVLERRRAPCTGFANLFSCLCAAEGIETLFMIGGTSSGGYQRSQLEAAPANHAWNAYLADGQWHFSDSTWISDLSYENGEIFGGEQCLDYYADFDFGGMCIEHRIDRCEKRTAF
ncbi:MAG: transglutaminase domain-containing protein [Oscillospiraceae bacterium]|nr:transglutaminase domain-containing protein [Oscillospiraceae bacterium]